MIGKLVSTGFRVATLPARLTFRSVRALAMTPAEASRLVAEMRRDPQTGLLQTVPVLHGGRTLFARWQGFGSRVYGGAGCRQPARRA